jgi:hypothetical protein
MIVAIFLHLSRIIHDNPVSYRICELIDESEQGGTRKRAGIAVTSRTDLRDAPNGANANCRGTSCRSSGGQDAGVIEDRLPGQFGGTDQAAAIHRAAEQRHAAAPAPRAAFRDGGPKPTRIGR